MRRTIVSLILGIALVGCGSSNDEAVVEEAPLNVIFTFPSAETLPTPPMTGLTNLSVTFNRSATRAGIEFSTFPTTTAGAIETNPESRKTWTWRDVDLDSDDGCYFWLIDGTRMGRYVNLANGDRAFLRIPLVVRIPSSVDRQPAVGFSGKVQSLNQNVLASGTVIFVLPIDSGFNPLDPGTFDASTAIGIALAARSDDFVEEDATFRATLLPVDTQVLVVAVQDTNNDLHYSPIDDWWGMYTVDGEFSAAWARLDTGEKDSQFNEGVDIVLQVPVPLPELP